MPTCPKCGHCFTTSRPAAETEWDPQADAVLKAVTAHTKISREDLLSSDRAARVAQPRQLVYYVLVEHLGFTTTKAGQHAGGRNHATVIHGITQIEKRMRHSKTFEKLVQDVIKDVRAGRKA